MHASGSLSWASSKYRSLFVLCSEVASYSVLFVAAEAFGALEGAQFFRKIKVQEEQMAKMAIRKPVCGHQKVSYSAGHT